MHRRDLLKLLFATPAALVIDVEKLLWIPGEKKIFIPSNPFGEKEFLDSLYYGGMEGGGKSDIFMTRFFYEKYIEKIKK